jgi:hypothetical protein
MPRISIRRGIVGLASAKLQGYLEIDLFSPSVSDRFKRQRCKYSSGRFCVTRLIQKDNESMFLNEIKKYIEVEEF